MNDEPVRRPRIFPVARAEHWGRGGTGDRSIMSGAIPGDATDAAAPVGRPASWSALDDVFARERRAGARDRLVQRAIKRAIDVLGSSLLILVTLPLALVVVLAIAIDSRGPVFFVQQRVGRNGVPFPLLKFRTMVRDAERALARHFAADEEQLLEWQRSRKLRVDPRIMRVGGFLRRFSIDELPQLLNVLRGNMSLVGPRPVVPDEVFHFGERGDRILSVRPGLTGLWAVSGRSDISYDHRVELEFRYAVGWSLWMDAKILLRTIPVVVRGHGAY